MPSLWKFGGLTPLRLTQFAINKIGKDELSTSALAPFLHAGIFQNAVSWIQLSNEGTLIKRRTSSPSSSSESQELKGMVTVVAPSPSRRFAF